LCADWIAAVPRPGAHPTPTLRPLAHLAQTNAMIIQDRGNELLLIRQTDHALLAGFFARQWGNELFRRPEPFNSFQFAAAEHDNGWREWELEPQVDPVTFTPYSYVSIPTSDHMELYRRGIERVVKADRYAGLLVSLHCAGLYDRARATLPGFSAKYVKANETPLVTDYVQALRLQQLRLKVDLRAESATKSAAEDRRVEANLKRLEALDCLSLFFCQYPLGQAVYEGIPLDDTGNEADWELRPTGENSATLSPYPFKRNPISLSILARRIPKRRYTDSLDLQKTLAQAPYFALNYSLGAGGMSVLTRAVSA
jgi:hypothetical protein